MHMHNFISEQKTCLVSKESDVTIRTISGYTDDNELKLNKSTNRDIIQMDLVQCKTQ